jgi:hypothetical protein
MKKLKLNRQTVTHLSSSALAAAVGAGSGISRQECISQSCNTCHANTCNCPTAAQICGYSGTGSCEFC